MIFFVLFLNDRLQFNEEKRVFVLLSIPLLPSKTILHQTKEKNSLVRSPALAYAVRISQVVARITLEVLTAVQLSSQREFILVCSVFALQVTRRYTKRHSRNDTRETRASATSPAAL